MKKIIITGGHFTPGLAIIPKLTQKGWKVYWAGETRAVAGKNIKTLEATVLPGLDVPFFQIYSAKLSRDNPLLFLLNIWKLPVGFIQSLLLLAQVRPQAILSFGSYVSLPVSLAGFFLGTPIIVHEQTAASGLANRLVAHLARVAAISFPSSSVYFPKGKTYLTGNLIREDFYHIAKKKKMKTKTKPPYVLYITGGSRGSQAINRAVFEIIPDLVAQFGVYHQTGSLDYPLARSLKYAGYHRAEVYTPKEVEVRYLEADLVVSRAGANTVSEIAVCGIPTIFIPLPFAGSEEQTKNAQMLKEAGLAEILPQEKLSGERLLAEIRQMAQNLDRYKKNAGKTRKLVPRTAAKQLVELIEKHAQGS